ncbi:hypothetical protein H4R19_004271, partial [Coemansia spiralis]
AVGLPLVYRFIVIDITKAATYEHDDGIHATANQAPSGWLHNLDLIVGGGFQCFVKRLAITKWTPHVILAIVHSLQQVFSQSNVDCSRISGLFLGFSETPSRGGTAANIPDVQRVTTYAQQFAQCLPN